MKYNIEEIWNNISSDNIEIQNKGYEQWDKLIENKYFDFISEKLPSCFSLEYQKINLHDFKVIEIKYFYKKKNQMCVEVILFDYYNDYGENLYYKITYSEVKEYTLNFMDLKHSLMWGNDIFEIINEKVFKHRVMLSDGNFYIIMFKDIKMEVISL